VSETPTPSLGARLRAAAAQDRLTDLIGGGHTFSTEVQAYAEEAVIVDIAVLETLLALAEDA
jgi:hypothetical protein